jgi:ribose transport system permease protein
MSSLQRFERRLSRHWFALRTNVFSTWRMDQVGALLGLIFLVLAFSLFSSNFRQVGNLLLIATMASTIGIVAVGQTMVLLTGGIDLSVSSVVALTGLIAASLMRYGWGPIPALSGSLSYVAIGIGLLVGACIGAAQGWLIANRHMPPFIVTLGTMVGLAGLTQAFAYGWPTNSLPDDFKWISDGYVWVIPTPAFLMLGVYLLFWLILRNTKFGRYCFAVGGNETAARLSGVNVDRQKTLVYAISGLLAGFAGIILIAYIDGANATNGSSYELYSIAAAILGGSSLGGGVGGVWGTLVGVLIITVIPNGMIMLNALPWWKDAITGGIILLAVLIDVERRRARLATATPDVNSSLLSGRYLNELLTRMTQTIEEHVGIAHCRMYLADRDTGELVPQTVMPEKSFFAENENQFFQGRNSIFQEAKLSKRPVYIPDMGRRHDILPIRADSRSAIILPLLVRTRVIGILEVQSPVLDAFSGGSGDFLLQLAMSLAPNLEDAWLLENGWLMRQTRDGFRHLWDDHYLARSPFVEWMMNASSEIPESAPSHQGEMIRNMLLAAIDGLRPPANETRDSSRAKRGYRILQLTYVEERSVDEIVRELHMSRRQYFYDLKETLEVLTDELVRNRYSGSS